jgi:hypothetical protein
MRNKRGRSCSTNKPRHTLSIYRRLMCPSLSTVKILKGCQKTVTPQVYNLFTQRKIISNLHTLPRCLCMDSDSGLDCASR